jgi:WD40 repeat protein
MFTLTGHDNSVNNFITFSGDRYLASVSTDHTLRKWDLRTREQVWSVKAYSKSITGLSISPDETTLATGAYDGRLKLWNVETGEMLAVYKEFPGNLVNVLFLPDGKHILGAGLAEELYLWNTETGELENKIPAHETAIAQIYYEPRHNVLLTAGNDKKLKQWDITNWTVKCEIDLPAKGAYPITVNRSGTMLAVACERRIGIYTFPEMNLLQYLHMDVKGIYGLDFSQDEIFLAVGCADKKVIIWEIIKGEVKLR